MRVLQINATYGYGSTGRNVQETHDFLLKSGIDSYVAWATAISGESSDGRIFRIGNTLDHKIHAVLARLTGKQGFFSHIATGKLCKKINSIHPDVVHLHNLHSNYIDLNELLQYLIKEQYPILLTLHDCWFFTGKCYHFLNYACTEWIRGCGKCPIASLNLSRKLLKLKKDSFDKINKLGVIGVSEWISGEAKKSILDSSIFIKTIYNWVDTDVFKPCETSNLRTNLNITDEKIILGVSQGWSKRKGLSEFLQISEKFGGQIKVLLIGNIEKNIELPENVISIGFVANPVELAKYYSMADVFVNPSRMETFGKVIAESMACGTPVVAYSNTGMTELIKDGCGYVAKDGDIDDMLEKIKLVISKDKIAFSDNCIKHVKNEFNMETQIRKYIDAYNDLIK